MKRQRRSTAVTNLGLAIIFSLLIAAVLLVSPIEPSFAQTRENSPPAFDAFTNTLTVWEDAPVRDDVGSPVAATDPDTGDTLFYALTGGDVDTFTVDSATGQIRTKTSLDYEAKKDYWLHISVRDGKGPGGWQDLVADDEALVTIQVLNTDEPGSVSLDWSRPWSGQPLTATLADPDGAVSGTTWQWSRADSRADARNRTFTNITGATSASYTPVAADGGKYLRVTASYTDPHGSDKTAEFAFADTVGAGAQAQSILSFPEGTTATRSILENTPAGANIGNPVSASGASGLLYTLSGSDASSFSINPATGQLQTRGLLDYETETSYSVTVKVTSTSGKSATVAVTISVTDEPVEILGPSRIDFSENDLARSLVLHNFVIEPGAAALTLSGPDARLFSISSHSGLAFNEQPDFESPRDSGRNNVYNVTIRAAHNTDSKTHNVTVRVTNYNEPPVISGPEQVEFTEQTTGAVARYTATDPENDPIRWEIQDTDDWSSFRISRSGVLTFREPPDYERMTGDEKSYEVVVLASSGMKVGTDGIRTRVTIVDGADPPLFVEGYSTPRTVSENAEPDSNIGDPVFATIPQGTVSHTLRGTHAGYFTLDSATGQLKTRSALNYERRNSYSVTVRASSGGLTTDAAVTIHVLNEDEPGTVTLSSAQARARIPVAATLRDPDGGVTGETWAWETSTDQTSWSTVHGETSAIYTPSDDTVGNYLRATASYDDAQGPGKTAQTVSTAAVSAGPNRSPSFSNTDPQNRQRQTTPMAREVAENTAAGTDIGDPVAATDLDGDTLAYSLVGRDARSFAIVKATGQLRTKAALDYERKRSYSVVVRARDTSNAVANMTVNISVTNVDEPGQLTLSTSQPRVGAAVTATVTDPDGGVTGVSWQWEEADDAQGTGQQAINGATGRSYTPAATSQRKYLRATAAYTDTFGSGKTVQSQLLLIGAPSAPRDTGQGNNGNNGNNGVNPGLSGQGGGNGRGVTPVTQSPTVTVNYGATSYSVNEGSSVRVTVRLSSAAPGSVTLPVVISRGSAESGDYRVYGLNGGRLSFSQGSRTASFVVAALQDADSDHERLNLRFGNLLSGYSTGSIAATNITITDDDQSRINVNYSAANYSVSEGSSVQVTVRLSSAAPRSLAVPVTLSRGTAESGDYRVSGLSGGSLSFDQGHRSRTFSVNALQDDDADNESLTLSFGTLPQGINAGPTARATVTINDDEVTPPLQLSVAYRSANYAVFEGHSISVTVNLSANADRELHIPITLATDSGVGADYQVSGLSYGTLRFAPGDRTESFSFTALQDANATDEQVRLGFGSLPANVVLGSRTTSRVTIQDDDLSEALPKTLPKTINALPVFTEGGSASRSVAEQAARNTLVGLPVTATDPDGDNLTYQIGGADASYFSLNARTGQLQVWAQMDLEIKPSYLLTLSVSDGRGGTDHIKVSVSLTNIQEIPVTNRSTQSVALFYPEKPFYLETPDGAAAIALPAEFSQAPVFVRIESAAANCVGQWPSGDGRAYLTVRFFDTWGNPVEDPNLEKAVATLRFNSRELGGTEAAGAAYQRDGIRVYRYRTQEGDWARQDFSLEMDKLGVLALTVDGFNGLTCLAAFTHTVIPAVVPAESPTPEPQDAPQDGAQRSRISVAERELWSPESTPAPLGVADSGSSGDPPGGEGGPGILQATIGRDAPWWPRFSLLLGAPLLLGAVGWQVTLFLRERRRRSKTFTRPNSLYFWQ